MTPLILFLVGVVLCIHKHPVWGTLSLALAFLALVG